MELNEKTLAEFINEEHLNEFRTDDFEYEMKESFDWNNVISIDNIDHNCKKVVVRYNGKITTLEFVHSVFTGSLPHHYALKTLC